MNSRDKIVTATSSLLPRRGLITIVYLISISVLLGACSTVPVHSAIPNKEPLVGRALWTDDQAHPHVKVVLLHSNPPADSYGTFTLPLPMMFKVARESRSLVRLVAVTEVIDFDKWVVIIPDYGVPPGSVAQVKKMETSRELEVWRSTADSLELRYTQPCVRCGGAAINQMNAKECEKALPSRVFLVPRDRTLKIGIADTRCPPDLP